MTSEHDENAHIEALIELSEDAEFAHLLNESEPLPPAEPDEPEDPEVPGGGEQVPVPKRSLGRIAVVGACLVVALGLILAGVKVVSGGGEAASSANVAPTASGSGNLTGVTDPSPAALPVATTSTSSARTQGSGTGGDKKTGASPTRSRKTDAPRKPSSSKTKQPAGPAPVTTTTASVPSPVTVGVIRNLMTHYCVDLPGRTGSVEESVAAAQYTCD